MQPAHDRPLDIWSDDELLDQYRELTAKGGAAGAGDYGQLENIGRLEDVQAEMARRGLTLEDQATSLKDQGSEEGIHESDGLMPEAESLTGEPGISPPIKRG